MASSIPIVRLDRPTASEFNGGAAAGKPLLIDHVVESWKAIGTWTAEYLLEKAGTAGVPVLKLANESPDGRFFYGGDSAGMVSFGDCLPLLQGAAPRVYMAGVSISDYLPMLADDLDTLNFVAPEKQQRRQLWISGRNSRGPLHYDLDENIHVVVTGRKRFFLFDYSQTPSLHVHSMLSATPHYSRVDAREPDLARFPEFRNAVGYEVTVHPGQMIYIPTGCWHQVITEEPSVAINFWMGKQYLQMSTLRVLFNVAVRRAVDVASAPLRAIAATRRNAH
jgi:hypothetical protein